MGFKKVASVFGVRSSEVVIVDLRFLPPPRHRHVRIPSKGLEIRVTSSDVMVAPPLFSVLMEEE